MKFAAFCISLTGSLCLLQAQAPPPPAASPIVLTVGDEKITQAEFEQLIEVLPDSMRAQALTAEGKRKIAEQLAELKSLAQEAKRQKLDQEPVTRQELQLQIDQVLAGAEMQKLAEKNPVTETVIRKYYDDHKTSFGMVDARHILVRFKGSPVPLRPNHPDLPEDQAMARANDLRKKLAGGADFVELAKVESDDTDTGANGGDVGKFGRGQMIPEFEEAAFSQADGQISQPIHTNYGFHLIQTKAHIIRPFEDVREEIEAKVRPEHMKQLSGEVRKRASIVLSDEYFGKPEAAAPAETK